MRIGELVSPNYSFGNPHIVESPPQRDYYYIEHAGKTSQNILFTLKLTSVPMKQMRGFLTKPIDVPTLLGDWSLMNQWIQNMWEAVYNPMWLWVKPNGFLGIMHGHHRFRLLNAMDADKVWYYRLEAVHHKIGKLLYPTQIGILMEKNERSPHRGTIRGVCESCGKTTRWIRKTFNRISDVRLYCQHCGAENPYPWPGRL